MRLDSEIQLCDSTLGLDSGARLWGSTLMLDSEARLWGSTLRFNSGPRLWGLNLKFNSETRLWVSTLGLDSKTPFPLKIRIPCRNPHKSIRRLIFTVSSSSILVTMFLTRTKTLTVLRAFTENRWNLKLQWIASKRYQYYLQSPMHFSLMWLAIFFLCLKIYQQQTLLRLTLILTQYITTLTR